MARSRPRLRKARANGFSLVELLVVMFIVALLAGAAVLALPGDDARLRRDAEGFALRVAAARDEAIATGAPVAVIVEAGGYRFEKRVDGAWRPLEGRGFSPARWQEGNALGTGGGGPTRLFFDSVGLASEDLRIALARGGYRRVVHIARDGAVSVGR